MRFSIDVGSELELKLYQAVLLYKNDHGNRYMATVHSVVQQNSDGSPVLGAGQLLSTASLRELARQLGTGCPVEFLPDQVVARTPDLLAWWTPAAVRPMFFRTGSELEGISGKRVPHPALLFVVRSNVLYVRALSASRRPPADSKLAAAPYWNIDGNGAVCAGTMRAPKSLTVTSIAAWQQAFFQSEFTHPGGGGRLTKRRGGTAALWKSLAGKKRFPLLRSSRWRHWNNTYRDWRPSADDAHSRSSIAGTPDSYPGGRLRRKWQRDRFRPPVPPPAMLAFGHPGGLQVTLIDPDTVSETNCVRQPFCRTEIGLSKAIVLANRINLFWGLNWQGVQAQIQQIAKSAEVDLVIGCVDTRKARRAIDKWAMHSRVLYWLDLGNNASSGQFIFGQPKNRVNQKKKHRLPTVTEHFPEIADPDTNDDDQPSCSAAEALTRQEPFINQNLAYQALAMLTQL